MTPVAPPIGRLNGCCPHCEGRLEVVAHGVPQHGGLELRNILGCTVCNRQWVILVALYQVTADVRAKPRRADEVAA